MRRGEKEGKEWEKMVWQALKAMNQALKKFPENMGRYANYMFRSNSFLWVEKRMCFLCFVKYAFDGFAFSSYNLNCIEK